MTDRTAAQAKARYRALLAEQAKMSVADMWKLGTEIKQAKLEAYVAIEAERAVRR